MFLGSVKSGQAHLVAIRNQNQRKIMSQNFDIINKPICCKRDVLQAFEAKNSTEFFVSNCANCTVNSAIDNNHTEPIADVKFWCERTIISGSFKEMNSKKNCVPQFCVL